MPARLTVTQPLATGQHAYLFNRGAVSVEHFPFRVGRRVPDKRFG